MKNIYAAAIAVLLAFSARSQISSGQVLLGGRAAYANENIKVDESRYRLAELSISPSAGIFIVDKLAAGVRFTFEANRTRHINQQYDYRTRSRTYSPFVRYYFLPVSKDYNLFLETSLDYHAETIRFNGDKRKERSDGFSVAGGPVVFITRQIALELAFSYGKKYQADEHTTSLGTSLGFQFHFGKKQSK